MLIRFLANRKDLTCELLVSVFELLPRELVLEKDCNGDTGLHLLMRKRYPSSQRIMLLISRFPELRAIRNGKGDTALDMAQ